MGAEIDRLEIEVEAQATKANNALDKMVGKLERLAGSLGSINGNSLSGLSTGINDLSKSMQGMKNIGTADFTRLAKNISQIGSVDTSGINKTASAINRISASLGQPEAVINGAAAIGNLANGIAKLGNKSTLNAIDNMPKLAAAMNDLMVTLSKAPVVSNNLVDMTTALANLASNGSKVGSSAQSVTNRLNGYSASAQRASKSSRSLASVFGRLYANFFWVKRGADKLWQSIETSMDYVETLNYFDAAFGQVAESAVSQWEDAGAESAEAYYKSFSDRAKELTSKMSGFKINENGTLTATGQPSLGIDPEKMMNYQATFGQMASSMGVASETSLKLSQALTEIGADLASVKNLDFDKVWNDMASGLAGMSRTLDKYGVNIRNVNLQQKLNELGIQANITALNQNEKALLRAIILLDSTRYAWGDLAETINQPANQLRLIESNFQNLSRTIGNLFLPAVSQTLPYVNAMVIALQRLATWIGNLLGIDLSKVTSSVADSSFDFSTIADEAENATEAVNKLQKGIRKFDELDVITTPSSSGSGTGGISSGLLDDAFDKAYSEYQKAWDDAFDNMENRAQEIADKIEEFFAPVKNIFSDFFEGDFFAAGQDTSNLVAGILNWFADGIDNVPWNKIGQNIGDYLAGLDWGKILDAVGRVIWQGIKAAVELWKGSFERAPLKTLTITFAALAWKLGALKLTKDLFTKRFLSNLGIMDKFTIGLALSVVISTLSVDTAESAKQVKESLEKGLNIKDWSADDWFYHIINALSLGGLENRADTLISGEKISGILDGLPKKEDYESLEDYNRALAEYSASLEDNATSWEDVCSEVEDFRNRFNTAMEQTFGKWAGTTIPEFGEKAGIALKLGWKIAEVGLQEAGAFAKEKWLEFGDNMSSSLEQKWDDFVSRWEQSGARKWIDDNVAPWFTKERWSQFGDNIKTSISGKWDSFTEWWNGTGFARWWNDVSGYFSKDKWTWSGIADGMTAAWENAIAGIKGIWNKFAGWLNDKLSFSWDGFSIAGKEIVPAGEINLGKIPTFKTGGYVPTRFSMFMAGENGVPELMGTVGGKTAVAGGMEITGIRDAVFSTAQQEIELLRQQNQLLRELVNKKWGITQDEIGESARRYAKEEYMRRGDNVFII